MPQRLLTFIKYNNAIPVILGVLFLGFGGAMAASPEVRDAVISKEEVLVSVDNSYIVNTNLDAFQPSIQITEVTEDDENYYVGYSLQTIDLRDGAWGDTNKPGTLTVSKEILSTNDLGLYATKELGEVASRETEKLKETQTFEKRNGISQKVVATMYGGLVGKFLDTKEEVFEGYEPVRVTDEGSGNSSELTQTASTPTAVEDVLLENGGVQVSLGNNASTPEASMVMIGNNPAKIPTNGTGGGYSDNGVLAKDKKLQDLSVYLEVDGVATSEVVIDTRNPGVHTVRYTAKDSNNSMALERVVIVYDRYKIKEPALLVLGEQTVTITEGESYVDAGALAIDYDDGDLTHAITAENTVNTGIPGEYEVRYSVTDSDNNIVTATRRVVVAEKEKSSQDTPEEVGVNGTSINSSN